MMLRVWCEFLSPDKVAKNKVLKLLNRYGVTLGMAFPAGAEGKGYRRMMAACLDAGVPVMPWALLPEACGYWPSAHNVRDFAARVENLCSWMDKKGLPAPPWFAFDMEPPLRQVRALSRAPLLHKPHQLADMVRENRALNDFDASAQTLNRLIADLHARGSRVLAAASDLVALDLAAGARGLQRALATPVADVAFDAVSFMLYSTTMVSFSGGLLSHRDVRWYIYSVLKDALPALEGRAAVSLGVTAQGMISDRPHTSPASLLPDVQAALAAGVQDIAVFNLDGILDSEKPEAWFEMLAGAEPRKPAFSIKADALRRGGVAVSGLLTSL